MMHVSCWISNLIIKNSDIWLVCFSNALISFLCVKPVPVYEWKFWPAHTNNMWKSTSQTGSQTEGPARLGGPDVPMQTQRWDVCHACVCLALHRVTSWLLGCLEPMSAGKRTGGRETLTYTQKMKERPQMSCVSPGAKGTYLTQTCQCRKISFILWLLCRCERDSFGLAGGQAECQSCHGGGWPYQPSIDTGWRQGQFLLNMYTAAFGIDI